MIKNSAYYLFVLFCLLLVLTTQAQDDFIIGQDLSYVNQMEDGGAEFREDGLVKDVYQIFADNGSNLVRVRLWHNPSWQESLSQPAGVKSQYSNFEDVKETIYRAKQAGMKVMLGFHFSDFWCDPGRQILPKAWDGVSGNETALKDSIYNYVTKILSDLNNEDLMPEYVKVGNENNSGIMTHKGMNSSYKGVTVLSWDWARHARLYNTAIKAVRDISKNTLIKPKIALHVADHNDAAGFYNRIIQNGVSDFDIMGFTYYYSYHGGSPATVGNVIKNLISSHPGYEAMVVETGYLWDTQNIDGLGNIINDSHPSYQPVSPETQKKFMVDLSNEVQDAGGSGVIFWESAWVSTPCKTPWGTGSSQEHVAFFDHRNNLNYMKNGGGGWPNEFWGNGGSNTTSNVTFKVDMTDQDVSRGVFIVGTMTAWEFIEMEADNSIPNAYKTTIELNTGDAHAYYYLTTNSWDDYATYRETVPEACALSDEILNDASWTTDRAFIVPKGDTIIGNVWASCETLTSISIQADNQFIKVYPNPVSESGRVFVTFDNMDVNNFEIKLFTANGDTVDFCMYEIDKQQKYAIDGLSTGIYILELTTSTKKYSKKLVVQ